ncbi:hypothetical protein LCGC14_2248580, partial [marine sediment metagenome]
EHGIGYRGHQLRELIYRDRQGAFDVVLFLYDQPFDLASKRGIVQDRELYPEDVRLRDAEILLYAPDEVYLLPHGLLDGMLELIPSARVGFVGLYRDEATLKPVQYYFKVPTELDSRLVIAVDPMLATGNSSVAAIDLLKQAGATDLRFLCLLASPEGVARMKEAHPDVPVVTAALDERLNEKGYIVPGLGDAGDRMFGTK